MYLYTLAYFSIRGNNVKYGAVNIWADSIQEAKGYGIEFVVQKYPVAEGFSNHSVQVFQIDDTVIERAYRQIIERRSKLN